MSNIPYHLDDWLTTPEMPFYSKLTNGGDDVLHDHTFFEIFYILEGNISHELNGALMQLRAGDIVFLRPEDRHIFLREKHNTCRHRDVIMRVGFFKDVCDFISPELYENFLNGKTQIKFSLSESKIYELEENFIRIDGMLALNKHPYDALSLARVYCAYLLGMLVFGKEADEKNNPDWLNLLLSRLNDPTIVSQSWENILSPFFYSREHICRVFKNKTGKTLTEYLNDRRMFIAADKLAYSKDSVLSVCMELGYSSVAYFNNLFRQKYGCTPTAFRNKIRLNSDN